MRRMNHIPELINFGEVDNEDRNNTYPVVLDHPLKLKKDTQYLFKVLVATDEENSYAITDFNILFTGIPDEYGYVVLTSPAFLDWDDINYYLRVSVYSSGEEYKATIETYSLEEKYFTYGYVRSTIIEIYEL